MVVGGRGGWNGGGEKGGSGMERVYITYCKLNIDLLTPFVVSCMSNQHIVSLVF